MSILPTSSQISWVEWSKYYKISTPTFQLSPIEKPDMSPFLIHMTGKDSIISILKGKGTDKEIPKGKGFIQANIPEYNSNGSFDAEVVCFSDSPTFAIDFFRYRNIERWKADQSYGIGFDKSALVLKGARPVVYVQDDVLKSVSFLFHKMKEQQINISDQTEIESRIKNIILEIYPLLYPLLENHPSQGFIWEREWRFPNPNGLIFNYKDIRLICCPSGEEQEIRKILGEVEGQITYIHTWQEYDDITNYLKKQSIEWKKGQDKYEKISLANKVSEEIKILDKLDKELSIAFNSLESYEMFINSQYKKMGYMKKQKRILDKQIKEVRNKKEKLNKKTELPKKSI